MGIQNPQQKLQASWRTDPGTQQCNVYCLYSRKDPSHLIPPMKTKSKEISLFNTQVVKFLTCKTNNFDIVVSSFYHNNEVIETYNVPEM